MNLSTKLCPKCGREVTVKDGRFVAHGPGRSGSLFCTKSGQKVART